MTPGAPSATVILWVFAGYLTVTLLGAWVTKKGTSLSGFWTAHRSMGGLISGCSLSATFLSVSWSLVFGLDLYLRHGWAAMWLLGFPWLLVLTLFFLLAPRLRRIDVFSQTELLRHHFGARAGHLSIFSIFLVFLIWGGAELYVASQLIGQLTETSPTVIAAIITGVIALYLGWNGLRAVMMTDMVQYLFVLLLFGLLTRQAFPDMVAPPPPSTKFEPAPISLWIIVLTFLTYVPGWLIETDLWVRLQACRNDRAARSGILIAIGNTLFLMIVIPGLLATTTRNHASSGLEALSFLLQSFDHSIVLALAGLGLIAAAMSTIDSSVNIAAMAVTHDLGKGTSRGWNTAMVVLVSGLTFTYARFAENLQDAFFLSGTVLTTALFLPILFCYLKGATPRAIHATLLGGPFFSLLFYVFEREQWLAIPNSGGMGFSLLAMGSTLCLFGSVHLFGQRKQNPHLTGGTSSKT
jgi:SSS family solute:Na+ symporter